MSVSVMPHVELLPGKQQGLLDMQQGYLPDTRQYAGFINISILSEIEENTVVFYLNGNRSNIAINSHGIDRGRVGCQLHDQSLIPVQL